MQHIETIQNHPNRDVILAGVGVAALLGLYSCYRCCCGRAKKAKTFERPKSFAQEPSAPSTESRKEGDDQDKQEEIAAASATATAENAEPTPCRPSGTAKVCNDCNVGTICAAYKNMRDLGGGGGMDGGAASAGAGAEAPKSAQPTRAGSPEPSRTATAAATAAGTPALATRTPGTGSAALSKVPSTEKAERPEETCYDLAQRSALMIKSGYVAKPGDLRPPPGTTAHIDGNKYLVRVGPPLNLVCPRRRGAGVVLNRRPGYNAGRVLHTLSYARPNQYDRYYRSTNFVLQGSRSYFMRTAKYPMHKTSPTFSGIKTFI